MYIPESIKEIINNKPYTTDSIGATDSSVLCFEDMVLKIDSFERESDIHAEMLAWLQGKLPVSKLIAYEKENGKNYLLTSRIKGKMLCERPIIDDPTLVTKLMTEALKMLWSIDIADCPVDYSLNEKLKLARYYVEKGLCDTENVEPDTYGEGGFKDPADLLCWLENNRPSEELVLSHGDCCLPNIFTDNGTVSGFIDLGRCGKADKYQDIALCYRSLIHNYDGSYGYKNESFDPKLLFEYLQMEPNMEKIRYYILLDELF